MNIQTNIELIDFTGKQMKDSHGEVLTFGKAVSYILTNQDRDNKIFDSLKAYILATEFYSKKEVEVDEADLKKIVECIEKSKVYLSDMVNGQILLIIEKEKSTPKNKTAESKEKK